MHRRHRPRRRIETPLTAHLAYQELLSRRHRSLILNSTTPSFPTENISDDFSGGRDDLIEVSVVAETLGVEFVNRCLIPEGAGGEPARSPVSTLTPPIGLRIPRRQSLNFAVIGSPASVVDLIAARSETLKDPFSSAVIGWSIRV